MTKINLSSIIIVGDEKMINRKEYLEKLIHFKDKELIKVVTGIRRCGKSTLFRLYVDYLLQNGIEQSQIIRMNLEDPIYHEIDDYLKLYHFIKGKLHPSKKSYVFLDEVQNVPEFQKAVDGLYIQKNVDLYITGSNAFLLSGELATLLSGRYVEIKMLPLSFKEFITTESDSSVDRMYQKYISFGSFPYVLNFENIDDVDMYIKGIYDSIVLKDIMARKKFPDYQILQSIIYFMLDNIGNLFSTNKIADTMTSNGRSISVHTVESYLTAFMDSFILYKATRYDIKGKQYLKTGDKYYVADLGLRYFMLGRKEEGRGHVLENVVYLELLRRGYDVYIGKIDDNEIDFVAINSKGIEYYQVAETVRDEATLERELRSLDHIPDHYPKYLLTMDIDPETSYNGIRKINVLDWLLDK